MTAQFTNFKIYSVDAASQSTSGSGVLVLSWKDERLAWDTVEYPDVTKLQLEDMDTIWRPVVVISNQITTGGNSFAMTVATTVNPDGHVVWEVHVPAGDFRCSTM